MKKVFDIVLATIITVMILVFLLPFLPLITKLFPCRRMIPATESQIKACKTVFEAYKMDLGHYPTTSQGLKALLEKPAGPDETKWYGPYVSIKYKPIDAWGHELRYQCPGTHNPTTYDLWSFGADGKEGGTGKNADIGNW